MTPPPATPGTEPSKLCRCRHPKSDHWKAGECMHADYWKKRACFCAAFVKAKR